jgi:hypothetical protein
MMSLAWKFAPNSPPAKLTRVNDQAIRRVLEAAGVEFIDEKGGGPGVRLRNGTTREASRLRVTHPSTCRSEIAGLYASMDDCLWSEPATGPFRPRSARDGDAQVGHRCSCKVRCVAVHIIEESGYAVYP